MHNKTHLHPLGYCFRERIIFYFFIWISFNIPYNMVFYLCVSRKKKLHVTLMLKRHIIKVTEYSAETNHETYNVLLHNKCVCVLIWNKPICFVWIMRYARWYSFLSFSPCDTPALNKKNTLSLLPRPVM
jgi:hypothetical protein